MIYTITLNPAMDKIIYLEQDLTAEKNNVTKEKHVDLGGKATHVSAILEQLHTPNRALGFAGSQNKSELVSIFNRYHMSHHFIDIADQSTRESIILINNSGGSYMITEKGLIISNVEKEQIYHFIKEHIKTKDIVVIGGKPPRGFTADDFRYLIQQLKALNVYIACDVSQEYLKVAIEEKVDFVKPNEHEINELFPGNEPIQHKLKAICEHVPNAVCSLGSEGALYKLEDKFYKITPPPVKIKSDTGAGDAFVTGYIYGVYNNYSIAERMKWGIRCSASKVQHYSSCEINPADFRFIEKNLKINEVI